ncbi:MAG: hypothetical protein ACP5JJ_00840, partial [Anaerolineae bacterium]
LLTLGLASCGPGRATEVTSGTAGAGATPAGDATATPTSTPTSTPTWTPESLVVPTDTPTPTPQIVGPARTEPPPDDGLLCPAEDRMYQLDYVHRVVQDMSQAHVEHEAEPGAAFFLTIRADGTVDSDGFENLVGVSILGNLEDCILEGSGELSALIGGSCSRGIATLQITEHWEWVTTTVTCPGSDPQTTNLEGFFSAPETQFDFRLTEEGDTQILEADTGILSVYYSWTLHR